MDDKDSSPDITSDIGRKRKLSGIIDESDSDSEEGGSGDDGDNNWSDEENQQEGIDDEEEDNCPICLSVFTDQPIAIPENCSHEFCNVCLQEWTKNVNNCPVDRKKFNAISVYAQKNGQLLEEVYIEDKTLHEDIEEVQPTFCQVCNQCDREDVLLLCDECDNGYHLDCLTPALSVVPVEEWFCSECQSQSEDPDPRSMIFSGSLSQRRARTASRGRGRGRGRSRDGRGRSRDGRSRSNSSRRRKKTPKKKKKRRVNSNTAEGRKKIEKMKKKRIEEELQKIRERLSERQLLERGSSFSVFGDEFALNDFNLSDDSDDWYKKDEVKIKPCISESNDVVSDILDGLDTLLPDRVVVMRDGSLVSKKKLEEEKAKIVYPKETKKKRLRRVKFFDEDGGDDSDNSENNKEDCQKVNNEDFKVNSNSNLSTPNQAEKKDCKTELSDAIALFEHQKKQNEVKKKKEKERENQLKHEIEKMRSLKPYKQYKDYASLHSLSTFKIPKKEKEVDKEEDSKLSPPKNEAIPQNVKSEPERPMPQKDKKELTLEKKCELYLKGKYARKSPKKITPINPLSEAATLTSKRTITSSKSTSVLKPTTVISISKTSVSKPLHVNSSMSKNIKKKAITAPKPVSALEPSTVRSISKISKPLPVTSSTPTNIKPLKPISPTSSLSTKSKSLLATSATSTSSSTKSLSEKTVSKKPVSLSMYRLKNQNKLQSNWNLNNQISDNRCEDCISSKSLTCSLTEKKIKENVVKTDEMDKKKLFEDLFGDPNLEKNLADSKTSTLKNVFTFPSDNNKYTVSLTPKQHTDSSINDSPFDHFLNEVLNKEETTTPLWTVKQPKPIAVVSPLPFCDKKEDSLKVPLSTSSSETPLLRPLIPKKKKKIVEQQLKEQKSFAEGTEEKEETQQKQGISHREEKLSDSKPSRQIIDSVKEIVKVYFKKRIINKDQYKAVMKLAVTEVQKRPQSFVGKWLQKLISELVAKITLQKS